MLPRLTSGAINRIRNGEDVINVVVQLLGCQNILSWDGDDLYQLLISDGATSCPFAVLGQELNKMIQNKELSKYTIVQVDKYICESNRKIIMFLSLTVLVPGNKVNKILGNPVNSLAGDSSLETPAKSLSENFVGKKSDSEINSLSICDTSITKEPAQMIIFPQLTSDAINKILNKKMVTNAVLQILGYEKISKSKNKRYRFIISDGVTDCHFAMLGQHLNYMVLNKELEKFTIVQVDNCICYQVQADRKAIILLSLTVLVPGKEVNGKLENPVNSSDSASTKTASNAETESGPTETDCPNKTAISDCNSSITKESTLLIKPLLTAGVIKRMWNGENVTYSVLQILHCKKFPEDVNCYEFLISDGLIVYYAILGSQLNHMVANEELEAFTIVRVDKCICNQLHSDLKSFIFLKLTVLVPANKINEQLGNPSFLSVKETAEKGVQTDTSYSEKNATASRHSSIIKRSAQSIVIQLSSGCINQILKEEIVENAIIQILDCRKVPAMVDDCYQLHISDGTIVYNFVILGKQLNHMVRNKELEKFTIVQIDNCICQMKSGEQIIILLKLTVLVLGSEINETLGLPISFSTDGASMGTATNGSTENDATRTDCVNQNAIIDNDLSLNTSSPSFSTIKTATFDQRKWTIKARITSKTKLHPYRRTSGKEESVLSVDLLGENGEIIGTGFIDNADKYFYMFELNKVYYIFKVTLKTPNERFWTLENNYEIIFNNNTSITPCEENSSSIPMMQNDFKYFIQKEKVKKDSKKEIVKDNIELVDISNQKVNLSSCEKKVESFENILNPVVAIKNDKVSNLEIKNKESLSITIPCPMPMKPNRRYLKAWYKKKDKEIDVSSISSEARNTFVYGQWLTFSQAANKQLDMVKECDYFMNKATLVMDEVPSTIINDCFYKVCPRKMCEELIIDMNNGIYRCKKCNLDYNFFKWLLVLTVIVADFTGSRMVTCYNRDAETILGVTAEELRVYKETNEKLYKKIFNDANFKSYIFNYWTILKKADTRFHTSVFSVKSINQIQYLKKLICEIKQLEKELEA